MKTALVTGATAGFGTAICKLLIASGYKVIGTGRRAARLAELHSQLGNNFLPLAFDVSDEKATEQALNSRPEGWKLGALVVDRGGVA